MIKDLGKTEKYNIYIGMKDKDSLKQKFSRKDFINIIREVCANYKIAFSMHEVYGGYMMCNGTFVSENSLVLSISGFSKEQVFKLAEELRIKLNQETILISMENPTIYCLTDKEIA